MGFAFLRPNRTQRHHGETTLVSILSYHQGDSLYTKEHFEIKGFIPKINVKIKTKLGSVDNDTSRKQHFTGDSLSLLFIKGLEGQTTTTMGTNAVAFGLLLLDRIQSLREKKRHPEILAAWQLRSLAPTRSIPLHCPCWRVPLCLVPWPPANKMVKNFHKGLQ